jgi:hypothetical protein
MPRGSGQASVWELLAASSGRSKLLSAVAGLLLATLVTGVAHAGSDITAQRLLDSWHDDDPGMRMVAEVIARTFASGFSWGGATGKRTYCAPLDLKGPRIMSAFEAFMKDNPDLAEQPYGAAMSQTLAKTSPCGAL